MAVLFFAASLPTYCILPSKLFLINCWDIIAAHLRSQALATSLSSYYNISVVHLRSQALAAFLLSYDFIVVHSRSQALAASSPLSL
jgi:hypothetical protein